MIMVLAMIAAIWGIGAAMKAPRRARWAMTFVLLGAVIIAQLVLPADNALRLATGGDVRLWLLLIGFGVLVWGYRRGLRMLKSRVAPTPEPAPRKGFSDAELNRYARHIMLREVGGPGQSALKGARVLVVGAGGLGSPALLYLAASGIGTLAVIDDDDVDASNLQRQIIHRDQWIGMPKVAAAKQAVLELNPHITLRPYHRRLTADIAAELIADYDLVLDGCDNFDTRELVNRTCVAAGVPLIAGALTQWEGQISLYDPARGGPCLACVFPNRPAPGLVPTCAEAGVIGPLPGVVGSMMAVEAVKLLTDAGTGLRGRLLIYDALYAETRLMKTKPRADCAVCQGRGLHTP
ncbi:molybdopterin-synthase adenylyltransferase MoeB [Loktanella sp. SALINAS62]|uniref:HesA/MoeB/ThiF family protein n=1 Tax=Loktanella sp. SALINAS62 TaxID=2706124 RepID=UPI001B8C1393|nr:molybdopterin-synthase adenylyltransferase MoeB [Loktanella sp. SALINAS62]MBS1301258.1 molybdopterin-synthase adenylyltransferase MoeB [Loktanella sp. SALINAS62]